MAANFQNYLPQSRDMTKFGRRSLQDRKVIFYVRITFDFITNFRQNVALHLGELLE